MSYAFLGHKWGPEEFGTAAGPVTWEADLSGLQFDSASWSLGDFETALVDAFQDWEDVAAIDFEMVMSGADVLVQVQALAGPIVGVTTWDFIDGPGLDNPFNMELIFDLDEVWSPDGTGGDLNFYAVAAHEVGHVLGLDHVSDPDQLMYDFIGPAGLADGDITGAQILYGLDAGDTLATDPLPAPPPDSAFDPPADDDGGGGGGGILVLLLGLIGAIVAGFFGAGPAALAGLAAQTRSDEDDAAMEAWGEEALSILPQVPVAEHAAAEDVADDANDADYGGDLIDWF